ncbi:uncharacterized protein PAC_19693 [Phialocephala subalpina]|uniref:Zn(2)-C6 fungal-type domain-containing protein n=1 Tax=Phialocephala subalpina TaxID=576137 RepID=A0A1L7XXK5_9HELO|nr:uncharacterized protein PAC_19693 [Phialocephala subalpina]
MPESPNPQKTKRTRRSLPKTKTGCLTCRIRRVKCGEERPICLKCMKFGMSSKDCEYPPTYIQPNQGEPIAKVKHILPKTSSTSEIGIAPTRKATSNGALYKRSMKPGSYKSQEELLPFPSRVLFKSQQEYRFHQFFSEDVAHELAGFNPSNLWQQSILQAAEANPFIRHAVIAVGALYKIIHKEPHMRPCDAHRLFKAEHDFAVLEYQKSLVSMRDAISTSSMDVRTALIACLLTVCFENAYGRKDLALLNCFSGTKLRRKFSISPLGNRSLHRASAGAGLSMSCFAEDELVSVFSRLDLSSMLFVDFYPADGHRIFKDELDNLIGEMPSRFNTMEEAVAYGDILTNRCWHFLNIVQGLDRPPVQRPWGHIEDFHERWASFDLRYGSNPWMGTDRQVPSKWLKEAADCFMQLEKWLAGFDPMWQKLKSSSEYLAKELPQATLLRLQAISSYISVKGSLYRRETEWDAHIPEFEEIVSLSESYMSSKPKRFYFSFDGETLIYLYYVLWKCRDGVIRRRVLKVLDEHPRREGSWDAGHIASVGRWVLSLEEGEPGESECHEIEEDDRVRLLGMDYDTVEGHMHTWGYRLRNGERSLGSHHLLAN